nr:putative reverse transcriptase domain-containing protein [Tanacetum cinerariifolium]
MLKVSPWKGVIRFGKRGKLNPYYIGPFKISARVGIVVYRLELPKQLSRVHITFHVSKLKKCMANEPLVIPLDEIQVDDKLNFIEEPIEVMDREVKRLKQSRIPIFKVRWNSRRGHEFTWEREAQMQKKNEIQKMETELWNLTAKGNDLTAYTQRFQELILLCTRMEPDEEDIVERFIRGLPDNIQGNVIAANPARLQDAIRIANQLMDKKLHGYAARSAENKRRMESNPRDNRGQQPLFKRQNTIGQNVARSYMDGNNERKGYVGFFPYCNKCRLHHEGLCTIRCGNCKNIRHQIRNCRVTITPNTQGAVVGNQQGNVCYEYGRPRHFRKDCPKMRG